MESKQSHPNPFILSKNHTPHYSPPSYLQIGQLYANLHKRNLLTFYFHSSTHTYLTNIMLMIAETPALFWGSSTEGLFMPLSQNVPLAQTCEYQSHGTAQHTCKQGLPLLLQEVHSEMPSYSLSTCGHTICHLDSKEKRVFWNILKGPLTYQSFVFLSISRSALESGMRKLPCLLVRGKELDLWRAAPDPVCKLSCHSSNHCFMLKWDHSQGACAKRGLQDGEENCPDLLCSALFHTFIVWCGKFSLPKRKKMNQFSLIEKISIFYYGNRIEILSYAETNPYISSILWNLPFQGKGLEWISALNRNG